MRASRRHWLDWGLFAAADFERQGDGAYVHAGEGSPVRLRCIRQDGAVVYAVDGAGDPYTYRLAPFASGDYLP